MMKQIIAAALVSMMVATSATAMSLPYNPYAYRILTQPTADVIPKPDFTIIEHDWNYFWGTTVHDALDPKTNGWDELFGVTLNPANTGWNDFWNQCQDPNKTTGDCMATVATGAGLGLIAPVIIVVAATGIAVAPQIVIAADVAGIITIA